MHFLVERTPERGGAIQPVEYCIKSSHCFACCLAEYTVNPLCITRLTRVFSSQTPDQTSLNLRSPVKAVPLTPNGVTSAEGAWQGGWDQAHVLPPLLMLVCLIVIGVGQQVRSYAKQRSNSRKTKVSPDASEIAGLKGASDGAARSFDTVPEFAEALAQGLMVNLHDTYEIQEQVVLSHVQEELRTVFDDDGTLTTIFGSETVQAILAEVGDSHGGLPLVAGGVSKLDPRTRLKTGK